MTNVDAGEVAKFRALAAAWWDPRGQSRALHDLNPCRLEFITQRVDLATARVIDVGCGGGILTEALARRGAAATGIDVAEEVLAVAREHAAENDLAIDYHMATAESFATTHAGAYDIATCMELIEHVPEPGALVAACAQLVRPGGAVFLSTINRTPAAYALAVVGAEYVLGLLPRGTHDYRRFVRPAELARWVRAAGLEVVSVQGMNYNPLTRHARQTRNLGVNYLMHARRELG